MSTLDKTTKWAAMLITMTIKPPNTKGLKMIALADLNTPFRETSN